MNKKQAITSDRMFLGAFVNAYSRPVIEVNLNISLIAIRMYLGITKIKKSRCIFGRRKVYELLTIRIGSKHLEERLQGKWKLGHHMGWSTMLINLEVGVN